MIPTAISCTYNHCEGIIKTPLCLQNVISNDISIPDTSHEGVTILLKSFDGESIKTILDEYNSLTLKVESSEEYFIQNITIQCQYHNGKVTILNSPNYNSCDIQGYLRRSSLTKCYPGFDSEEAIQYLLNIGYHVEIRKK